MEMEWWNWVTLTLTGTILVANAVKALFHLVNHSIDGNGIEGLKKVRNELSNSIIER